MPVLFIILIIAAIVIFGFGIFVAALKFLIIVGIILFIIGVIGWILRSVRNRT
ncbi:hypothetical protein GCM10025867_31730 [Frondihabitans sucicola]|uniref:DUF2207 domain-containing protein n=1 Tax=Frondihabitans sucicola TaxID=1268041 RepID=A0ABM8GR50_9MICO|nr:hypothetical protein [Frondihabitans sucicola]BDZ50932.1 hypothetical protein GCM10025867_31730 [Frondihabitans sucicola]